MRLAHLVFVAVLFCNSCTSIERVHNKNCSTADCMYADNGNRKSDLLSAILCNGCLEIVVSNPNMGALLISEIQRKIIYGDIRTIFTDLNADVQSLILDEMVFLDIINLLRAYQYLPSPVLSVVARANFWRKFKGFEVEINLLSTTEQNYTIFNETKWLTIRDFTIGKNLLRHFGGEIERFQLKNPSSYPSKCHLISILTKYLGKYAIKSLTHLNLDFINSDTFKNFKRPFSELRELSFNVSDDRVATGNLTLSLFPKLESLNLILYRNMDYSFLLYEYPSLTYLKFYLHFINWKYENQFEEMLNKAYGIRSLEMSYLSQKLCDIINRCLPNLENLTISHVDDVNETRFEHVQNVQVRKRQSKRFDGLTFPHLKTLLIVHTGDIIDKWTEFFRRHRQVTHLKIIDLDLNEIHVQLAYHQRDFHQVISELTNLTEITFEYSHEGVHRNPFNLVEQIIGRNENCQKFNLLAFPISDDELNELRERFENEWNFIVAAPYRCDGRIVVDCSIEKKELNGQ